jgi:hypothetical protein
VNRTAANGFMLTHMSTQAPRRPITVDDRDTLEIATGIEVIALLTVAAGLLIWWLS